MPNTPVARQTKSTHTYTYIYSNVGVLEGALRLGQENAHLQICV